MWGCALGVPACDLCCSCSDCDVQLRCQVSLDGAIDCRCNYTSGQPPMRVLSLLPPCSSKSTIASEAACKLNPALRINPLQNRVSPETENVFNDTFWEGLDMVVNALDNVNARLYVDSR